LLRQLGKEVAITATNNSTQAQTVALRLPQGLKLKRLSPALGGAEVHAKDGTVTLVLPALFGTVLLGTAD
jgi:hypothetical protein